MAVVPLQAVEVVVQKADGTAEYIVEVTPLPKLRCGYVRPCSLVPDANEMTSLRAFASAFFAAQPQIIPQGTPIVFPVIVNQGAL